MKEINVYESYFLYRVMFESSFPKLEHLMIDDPCSCTNNSIEEFLLRHSMLKTFSIRSDEDHMPVLRALAASPSRENLEKLEFGFEYNYPVQPIEPSMESLSKFTNLREFKCYFAGHQAPKIIKEIAKLSLEVLDLSCGTVNNEIILTVSKMKSLKVFRLFDVSIAHTDLNPLADLIEHTELSLDICSGNNLKFDLVKIVSRLVHLTELKFKVNDYKIQKEIYLQLLNAVESRPGRNRYLVIDCRTTDDFQDFLRATVQFK